MGTQYRSSDGPATGAITVTPHDTNALQNAAGVVKIALALYVGVTGDVSVITAEGETVTFTGVTAASILPIRCTHVRSTGTTATNITALY